MPTQSFPSASVLYIGLLLVVLLGWAVYDRRKRR